MTTRIWGLHNDEPELGLVEHGFVSIGHEEFGDIREVGTDREALKAAIRVVRPEAKPGAIPVWAGVAYRFTYEMKPGDLVVYPHKPDSTVNIGKLTGGYRFDADAPRHRHRREVEWIVTDVPRASLTQSARYEIGSAVTLFEVTRHAEEFLALLPVDDTAVAAPLVVVPPADDVEQATSDAQQTPTAERVERFARDAVIDVLYKQITPTDFEHFVADLLRAMGYRASVTAQSGDGGVDVLAHRDPFGLESSTLKVQCKQIIAPIGAPDVHKLMGTLAPGSQERGLFVALGTYTRDAQSVSRGRQDLRLITGDELVDLVFECYEDLPNRWRSKFSLRRIYVLETDPEAG